MYPIGGLGGSDVNKLQQQADRKCQDIVDSISLSSTTIAALLKHVPSNVSITCRPCSRVQDIESSARAFTLINPLEIVVCSNRVHGKEDIKEVMVHELVHAYDYSTGRYDMRGCDGLASSEVRANRDAECGSYADLPVYFGSLLDIRKWCTQHYAGRATANLFPMERSSLARHVPAFHPCVRRVIDEAYRDNSPLHEAGPSDR